MGSILGPLFYTLFTNELTKVVHEHHHQVDDEAAGYWPRYNLDCKTCGNVCCYADDTTYSCSDTDPQALSEQLTAKYKLLSEFLVNVQNVPKYPYFCLIWQLLKFTDILARFGCFLVTERSDQIDSFS